MILWQRKNGDSTRAWVYKAWQLCKTTYIGTVGSWLGEKFKVYWGHKGMNRLCIHEEQAMKVYTALCLAVVK